MDPTLELDGDTWRVLGTGTYADGAVICHLASTTQFRQQRNGAVPVQRMEAVDAEAVEAALRRPRGFFAWNRALQGAFRRGEQAAKDGATKADCPYLDKRKRDGRLTWSRSFQAAWCDGFDHAA
mgnify:CR=1 FL=1